MTATEFHVEVVRVGEVKPHPYGDRLEVTMVGGYPVTIAKGSYKQGDTAVYVPIDSVVPTEDPRWAFLQGHTRIRAKKLQKVFSMGLLTDADPMWEVGRDVATELGIIKYEPVVENPEQDEPDPGIAPVYGVEGWRKHTERTIFAPDELVVVMEKLHGENARFAWHQGRLWCGSHGKWKLNTPSSQWWNAARLYDLEARLSDFPIDIVLFGEIIGHVPDMDYGHSNKVRGLAFFDILDPAKRTFANWNDFVTIMAELGLPTAPVLYHGPFSGVDLALCDGMTTYPRAAGKHIREGFVIKPQVERQDEEIGRVALKLHGEKYLLRKHG